MAIREVDASARLVDIFRGYIDVRQRSGLLDFLESKTPNMEFGFGPFFYGPVVKVLEVNLEDEVLVKDSNSGRLTTYGCRTAISGITHCRDFWLDPDKKHEPKRVYLSTTRYNFDGEPEHY